MNSYTIIALATLFYWILLVLQKPSNWSYYLQFMPIVGFMYYVGTKGFYSASIDTAFSVSALLVIGAIALSIHERIVMNRLFLGANSYLLLGAGAYTFHFPKVLKWYHSSIGGSFFVCIAVVGLLTTLFTKPGFLGAKGATKDVVRYGSFLLLAAVFVALIWSIKHASQGMLLAIVIPFIVLAFIQQQLKLHVG